MKTIARPKEILVITSILRPPRCCCDFKELVEQVKVAFSATLKACLWRPEGEGDVTKGGMIRERAGVDTILSDEDRHSDDTQYISVIVDNRTQHKSDIGLWASRLT